MTRIGKEELRALVDFDVEGDKVRAVVSQAAADASKTLLFLARYASWNGVFGSGVASLAGKIGRSRALFIERGLPSPIADRSVLVASYFFDAARDEFDDRDTEHRDTHRCLAQAALAGMLAWAVKSGRPELAAPGAVEETLGADPSWLSHLRHRAALGYGNGWPDDRESIFRAIGYHLGSEVLADQEFSVIDTELRKRAPEMVAFLEQHEVEIAGQKHQAYYWIRIHSGHGGGAEADHFDWAVRGAHLAFDYTPPELHDALRDHVYEGYRAFAQDHQRFFTSVLS